MVKYPPSAYAPAMEVYKRIPDNLKDQATEIMQGYRDTYAEGEVPPYEMARKLLPLAPKDRQSELEEMIRSAEEKSRQEQAIAGAPTQQQSGLEAKTSTTSSYLKNAVGLAATLAGIALLGIYIP